MRRETQSKCGESERERESERVRERERVRESERVRERERESSDLFKQTSMCDISANESLRQLGPQRHHRISKKRVIQRKVLR